MLAEGKLKRYLLYAVGEIILVVIGILIALQINTAHQASKNKILERTYLENIREDLIIQKEIILEQLDHEARMLAKTDSCLSYLDGAISLLELVPLIRDLASRRTFTVNRATFDNLVSTGSMVLLRNPEMPNAVVRYYQQLEYTSAVISNNNLYLIDTHFGTFIHNNGLGLRMPTERDIDRAVELNAEKRFTLHEQLTGRKTASESIERISRLQLESTLELIDRISVGLGD